MPLIVHGTEAVARFRLINSKLTDYKARSDLGSLIEACSEAMKDVPFANAFRSVREAGGKKDRPIQTAKDMMDLMWAFFSHYLVSRDYVAAALILWGPDVFNPEPACVRDMWKALFDERMISIIGGGGQGKTYSPSAWMLLDWVLDPEWTRIQLASNSEDHLKKNLFADIVRLHSESALPLPGTPDAESISLDKKKGMGIFILTIPGGAQSKGKIKGAHTKPRPPHPLFGRRSRTRMIVDEAQEVAQNIFGEIPNRFSTVVDNDVEQIKFIVCANPKDPYSPFGQICKPKAGWESLTLATGNWRSEKGWWVISLNAMRHENVIHRRTIYPGFVTYTGVQNWLQTCGGDHEHPDMYTYVYGQFPRSGSMRAIVGLNHLTRSEREWIFDGPTEMFSFADWAFTGDQPAFAVARSGRAVAWTNYDGKRFELKKPAIKIQVDLVTVMGRGDTQDLADDALGRNKQLGVKPHCFGSDRTGVGQGPHDIVRRQWKAKVGAWDDRLVPEEVEGYDRTGQGEFAPTYQIHFGQAATNVKVAEEDSILPIDQYDGIRSEVWYVFARFCELDVLGLGKNVDPKTFQELASRQGSRPTGKGLKLAVESKEIYKSRTGTSSPDRADAITGVLHVARMVTVNLLPKARDTEEPPPPPREWDGSQGLESFGAAEISGFESTLTIQNQD